jgi:hypothetical protein
MIFQKSPEYKKFCVRGGKVTFSHKRKINRERDEPSRTRAAALKGKNACHIRSARGIVYCPWLLPQTARRDTNPRFGSFF